MNKPEHETEAALRASILISRLVDGEPTDDAAGCRHAWDEFASLAKADPHLWRELAESQRDAALLGAEVTAACTAAADFELPLESIPAAGHDAWSSRVRWGGWAVAATLALAWGGQALLPTGPGMAGNGANTGGVVLPAGYTAVKNSDEALNAYLEMGKKSGHVLGQAPELVMVKSQPAAQGNGHVVIYMRQIYEAVQVPALYEMNRDEMGNAFYVPVAKPVKTNGNAM